MSSDLGNGGLAGTVAAQHARIRDLFHEAAHAPVERREGACERLVRYLAVHEAAEQAALGVGSPPVVEEVRDLARQTERLDDLGVRCQTYAVQLGLLAAAVHHHVRRGEDELVPRFVIGADEHELVLARDALDAVEPLVAQEGPEAEVPEGSSFAGQLRAARRAVARRTHGPRPARAATEGARAERGRRSAAVSRRRAGP